MAKSKTLTSTDIKKLVKEKKVIIGIERTIKNLKLGRIDKVIMSSNCAKNTLEDIGYYAGLNSTETVKVSYSNEELGVICKKPFSISVISVLKGG